MGNPIHGLLYLVFKVIKYQINHSKGQILNTIDEKFNLTLLGQNRIWVKFYHFEPKNDGKKWSKNNKLRSETNRTKVSPKILLMKSSGNNFIFLSVFHLIMWVMKS